MLLFDAALKYSLNVALTFILEGICMVREKLLLLRM